MTTESEIREFGKAVIKCDECFGPIDSETGFCKTCGLEASDFRERRFNKSVLHGAQQAGEEETRYRKVLAVGLKQGRANRGFVCNRCRELFQNTVHDDENVEGLSKIQGFEQPGTNLYTFKLRREYEDHVKLVHNTANPKKGFYNRADKHIRKLGRLNRDTVAGPNQREGEKK